MKWSGPAGQANSRSTPNLKSATENASVTPIKLGLMGELKKQGWKLEEPLGIAILKKPGKLDAILYTDYGPVALEWKSSGRHPG